MARIKSTAVLLPNLGIYYDRPRLALNPRMLSDGLNFRVKQGRLSNLNMGWTRFGTFQLNGYVMMIADFILRSGSEQLVFATFTDLYKYVNASTVVYITPRYETGTVSRAGQAVLGVGTNFLTAGVRAGDQITFGTAGVVSTSATWDTVTLVTDATHLTTTGSGVVGSGPYTIRRLFTGTGSHIWQNALFVNASPSNSDELWMTNGLDSIVRWNGVTDQVEVMSALGFTAKAIGVYSNMMIFGNLNQAGTNKPTDMINSNPGEPQNVTSGLSEQFKVHGKIDGIKSIISIGDNLAIYSYENDGIVTLAQFVGDPLVFAFRQIANGTGPISAKAVADFGNFHEFVATDGQYFFDGATVKNVNKHFWREILRTQDPTRTPRTYAHFDEENGDLIWILPLTSDATASTTGAPGIAEVEHYLEESATNVPTPFSRRTWPFTATGYFRRNIGLTWDQLTDNWSNYNFRWNDKFFFAAFPLSLGGTDTGKIYTLNTAQDADGVALSSFIRFGRRAIFDGRHRGLLSRVYPFVHTLTTPLNVTARFMDHADGEPTIFDTKSFDQTLPQGGHFTTHYRRGRYFELEFGTDGPAQPWELDGYDTDVRKGGKR